MDISPVHLGWVLFHKVSDVFQFIIAVWGARRVSSQDTWDCRRSSGSALREMPVLASRRIKSCEVSNWTCLN